MSLADVVGFDYPQAILKLNRRYKYEEIAKKIGYENKGSISRIVDGVIPSHRHGEALWALYMDTFGEKPIFVHQKQQV